MPPGKLSKPTTTKLTVLRPTMLQLNEMIKDVRSPTKAEIPEQE